MRRFTLYDSLSRTTRAFAPITPPYVRMYVCGLTPYAEAHVGHGRFAVIFDTVARALRHWGYRVLYVQNVTNLDDKLIARAAEHDDDPLALADRNFADWRGLMDRLGVRSVNAYPFATDFVPEILAQITTLLAKDAAYRAEDGSVYFRVARFPDYGKLSGQRVEALRPGARLEVDARKQAPEDFVIWKAATPGEPSWDSPWGPGRPGWHIEDTAMTLRLFGSQYDLHGGGLDLIFPHHEAEIALAESTTGEAPLVRYWMHNGLLTMGGEKMSKTVGNVSSLAAAIEQFGPAVVRFFYLNAHYRSPLEFDLTKSLPEAREAYARLSWPADRIATARATAAAGRSGDELPDGMDAAAEALVEQLDRELAEDFHTREAIARLFGWGREIAAPLARLDRWSEEALESLDAPYAWGREVLGLFDAAPSARDGPFAEAVAVALDARSRARARGDFAEADRIRESLAVIGVRIEDRNGTTEWSRASAPS
jgi:cysteinyl-tRNA synthetase